MSESNYPNLGMQTHNGVFVKKERIKNRKGNNFLKWKTEFYELF